MSFKLNHVSLRGNITKPPELRFTAGGTASLQLSIAVNTSKKVNDVWEDQAPMFFDVQCWGQLAENVASSVDKGTAVVVTGELEQRSWVSDDGTKHNRTQIKALDVTPSLERATVSVERISRSTDSGQEATTAARPKTRAAAPSKVVQGEGDDEDF